MADYSVRFATRFPLHEALALLEDDEDLVENVESLTIFPPDGTNGNETDEDSGEEDFVSINNLPGAQLQAPVEMNLRHESAKNNNFQDQDFSSDDEIPLSVLKARIQKSKKPSYIKIKNYEWEEVDLRSDIIEFDDQNDEQNNFQNPLELFMLFFTDEMLDLIVNETNRYLSQKNHNARVEKSEIKAFIGVLLLSGYIQLPRRRMYWKYERDNQNILVSEAISRNKFEYILSHIHLADNIAIDPLDKFAKVRPMFQYLNRKFLEHSKCEEMQCVDEAMVPYFGRHGCKQFIHGKPIRYGYKLWFGATRLGYINWFEPYQGAATNISTQYTAYGVGPSVVLELADVLRKKWPMSRMHLFFDNFFSTLPLLEVLSDKNFKGTGTLRENRIPNSPLMDSKQMKKEARGAYDSRKMKDKNIIVVKWHDNSIVTLCSNAAGVNPIHHVKRFSRKDKKSIQVTQPHLVHLYNANMGGVDRSDQNLSLYRTSIRGKKWYFPLITQCVDMAAHNAWQLHRQRGGELDQLKLRRRLASTLLIQNKKQTHAKGHMARDEGIDIRFDGADHLVVPQNKQTRCGFCHERTTTRCNKCNKGLHVKCFVVYHTPKVGK